MRDFGTEVSTLKILLDHLVLAFIIDKFSLLLQSIGILICD